MKLPIFWIFSLSLIYAHAGTAAVLPDEEIKEAINGNHGKEESETIEAQDTDEANNLPTLACVLFGTTACASGCQTFANIYGLDGTGTCDEYSICNCDFPQNTSLDDLWGRKFEPWFVLPQIKRNQLLSEKTLQILQQPFKTAEETKEELKTVLKPSHHKSIRIIRTSPSATILRPNGKFDSSTAERFVATKLQSLISEDYVKTVDYKKAIREALKNAQNENIFWHLILEVLRSKNPYLVNALNAHLTPTDDHEYPVPESPQDIADFIHYAIINQLIAQIETPAKFPTRPKRSPLPPPPTFPTDHAECSRTIETVTDTRWSIPGINQHTIEALEDPVDQTWSGPDYKVRLKRSLEGDIELWWQKGDVDIYLHRHAEGALDQNWGFGEIHAALFRDVDDNRLQFWLFKDTRMDYAETNDGEFSEVWENDIKDENSHRKYQRMIGSWCQANGFLVGGERFCAIHYANSNAFDETND